MFTNIELLQEKSKFFIKLTVSQGTKKPYYLSEKGLKPTGVYVRSETTSAPASEDAIRMMIKTTDGDSFETNRSLVQELTFHRLDEELNTEQLLAKCYGLSLLDKYWMMPDHTTLKWSDINFYDHAFSDDVGNILFGQPAENEIIDLMSPCNTSDGWLKKKWKILGGKRCLIKSGSNPYMQEPLNEVFAINYMNAFAVQIMYLILNLIYQAESWDFLCQVLKK